MLDRIEKKGERPKKKFEANDKKDEKRKKMQNSLMNVVSGGIHKNKDPMYYLSECFSNAFDYNGLSLDVSSMDRLFGNNSEGLNTQRLKQFQKTAFKNGTLASSILENEGTVVLQAALKQSAYLSKGVPKEKQKNVLNVAKTYQVRNGREKVMFNKNETLSAVGMVIDATKSASQVLEGIKLSCEKAETFDTNTLRGVFPFLFDEEKQVLDNLEVVKNKMKKNNENNSEEYQLVLLQMQKITAVRQKKESLKKQFLMYLDTLIQNAKKAISSFEKPGIVDEIWSDDDSQKDDQDDDKDSHDDEQDGKDIENDEQNEKFKE